MADDRVKAVRRFNRFYGRRVGVLGEGRTGGAFSLTEARVLTELSHRDQLTATGIAQELDLDPGYLSRILLRFQKQGWIAREPSAFDRRQFHIVLTRAGRNALKPLDRSAGDAVSGMLNGLSGGEQNRLMGAMATIENLLADPADEDRTFTLRAHRHGDIGWLIHRHGALYAEEYGWGEGFEAVVAEIGAAFLRNFDADRERCWIAERHGAIAGSVMLVRGSKDTAKLRLLLVEPEARGLGIGKRLVAECIAFARERKYRAVSLWTQSNLLAARRIYEAAGFRLVGEQRNRDFGSDLISQIWELTL